MSTATIRKPGMIQDVGYFGSRISDNLTETKEGFLVCHSVPIARTGWQKYIGREIGLTGDEADKLIDVYRSPEEVFSAETMASFRGKPLTNNHPDMDVNPDNALWLVKGVVDNVRRGTGSESKLLLADIIAYDRGTIQAILDGKREVSCGYNCQYVRMPDGTYQQRDIRGNHVAIVDEGRAGARVSIRDAAAALVDWWKNRKQEDPRSTLDSGEEVNQEMDENEKAARKYGIAMKEDGHRSPPEGKPQDREDYGDPVNFKYPLTKPFIRAALSYFNAAGEREKGEYTTSEWETIGERLATAATRELGMPHKYERGNVINEEEKKEVKDRMTRRRSVLDSIPNGFGVRHLFTAIGLQRFAQDADPEEMMDALEELTEEEREDRKREEKGEDRKAKDRKGRDADPEKKDEDGKTEDAKAHDDDDERLTNLEKKMDELMSMMKGIKDKTNDAKTRDKSADEMIEDAMKSLDEALEGTEGTSSAGEGLSVSQGGSESGNAGPVVNEEGRPLSGEEAMERVTDAAAARAALSSLRPVLLSIKDEKERIHVTDAAIQAVMGAPKRSYAQVQDSFRTGANTAQQRAIDARQGAYPQGNRNAQQARTQALDGLGLNIAQSRNPHYKKQA